MQDLERRLGPAPAEQPAPPAGEAAAPEPGQFEVDPATIDRALEQALVRTGALLLPPGTVEVEPSFSYSRQESSTTVVRGGFLAENVIREDDLTAAATLRVGLPFDTQLDLFLPYSYENVSSTVRGGGPATEADSDISGFGDLTVTLTKAVFRERGWRPDLFARLRWDTDTGETDRGIPLGSGTHEIGGSVTAVKRQDPLVFVGTLSYDAALEDDGVDPGDEIGHSLGTVLAASPDTSLRFFLDQTYAAEAERDGDDIPGSDQVAASLIIGASSVIGRRLLVDVAAGIGLTDDAPDYSIIVSLPIRFDLPLRF